jgi:hypothetical protein
MQYMGQGQVRASRLDLVIITVDAILIFQVPRSQR